MKIVNLFDFKHDLDEAIDEEREIEEIIKKTQNVLNSLNIEHPPPSNPHNQREGNSKMKNELQIDYKVTLDLSVMFKSSESLDGIDIEQDLVSIVDQLVKDHLELAVTKMEVMNDDGDPVECEANFIVSDGNTSEV